MAPKKRKEVLKATATHFLRPRSSYNGSGRNRHFSCTCPICHKKISGQGNYRRHLNSHASKKKYKCPFPGCGKQVDLWKNLCRHVCCHDDNDSKPTPGHRLRCKTCGRFASDMQLHLKTCTPKSPLHLKQHIKLHSDSAFLPPPLKCTETRNDEAGLQSHVIGGAHQQQNLSHSGICNSVTSSVFMFACPMQGCNEMYNRRYLTQRHLKSAHNIDEFRVINGRHACLKVCPKTYSLLRSARRHLRECLHPNYDSSNPNWLPRPIEILQHIKSDCSAVDGLSSSSNSAPSYSGRTRSKAIQSATSVYRVPALVEPMPRDQDRLLKSDPDPSKASTDQHEASFEVLTEDAETFESTDEHIGGDFQEFEMQNARGTLAGENLPPIPNPSQVPMDVAKDAEGNNVDDIDTEGEDDENSEHSNESDFSYMLRNSTHQNIILSEDDEECDLTIPAMGHKATDSFVGEADSAIRRIISRASTAGAMLNPLNWWVVGSPQRKEGNREDQQI